MPLALVTGANRGLGHETARQLLTRGWGVLVATRDPAQGDEAARSLGFNARPVTVDLSDPTSIQRLIETLSGEPRLDAIVNNAGASFDGFDADVVRRTLAVNYRGPALLTTGLVNRLAPSANVVMVSSGMGELSRFGPDLARRLLDPALDRAALDALLEEYVQRAERKDLGAWPENAYSVSKAALNALTRILARELADKGHRVNAVCPGWVRTRMGGVSAPRSVERGASGIVWAATLGPDGPSGGFFRDERRIDW